MLEVAAYAHGLAERAFSDVKSPNVIIFFFFHIFIKFFVIIGIFAMGTKINDIISNHIVFIDLKLIF